MGNSGRVRIRMWSEPLARQAGAEVRMRGRTAGRACTPAENSNVRATLGIVVIRYQHKRAHPVMLQQSVFPHACNITTDRMHV